MKIHKSKDNTCTVTQVLNMDAINIGKVCFARNFVHRYLLFVDMDCLSLYEIYKMATCLQKLIVVDQF